MFKSIAEFHKLLVESISMFSDENGKLILKPNTATEIFKSFLVALKGYGYCEGVSAEDWNDIIKFNIFQSDPDKVIVVGAIRKHPDKAVLSVPVSDSDITQYYKYYTSIEVSVYHGESVDQYESFEEEPGEETSNSTESEVIDDSALRGELIDKLYDIQVFLTNRKSVPEEDFFIDLTNRITALRKIYNSFSNHSDEDILDIDITMSDKTMVVRVNVNITYFHDLDGLYNPFEFRFMTGLPLCKK